VAHPDAGLLHLDRVEVEDHVAEHGEGPLAVVGRDAHPEDGLPDLALGDALLEVADHETSLLIWNHRGIRRDQPAMKELGSSHCPSSHWNFCPLSTTMWPSSGLTEIFARSSGRGVGPSKLMPLL